MHTTYYYFVDWQKNNKNKNKNVRSVGCSRAWHKKKKKKELKIMLATSYRNQSFYHPSWCHAVRCCHCWRKDWMKGLNPFWSAAGTAGECRMLSWMRILNLRKNVNNNDCRTEPLKDGISIGMIGRCRYPN